jgi:hypothetical protein
MRDFRAHGPYSWILGHATWAIPLLMFDWVKRKPRGLKSRDEEPLTCPANGILFWIEGEDDWYKIVDDPRRRRRSRPAAEKRDELAPKLLTVSNLQSRDSL